MLVVSNQGEGLLLDAATGKDPATLWTLRLFVNDHEPAKTDTEAGYVEAAGGGYAGLPLAAADWVTTPGSPTQSVHPLHTFTFIGPLTINPAIVGYYVTRADGRQIYAERLPVAFTPANSGDYVQITPTITLASLASD